MPPFLKERRWKAPCPGLLALALAWPLACTAGESDETAATTQPTTGTTTDGPGGSVTSNSPSSTSTSTTASDPTTTTSIPTTIELDSGTSEDSDQGFILMPDGGGGGHGCDGDGGGAGKQCDPWTQDCPPGDKCTPTAGNCDSLTRNICTPVAPDPVGLGGDCLVETHPLSGRDDCDLGLLCAYVDPDSLAGTCVRQCEGSPDAPDCSSSPGTSCMHLATDDDFFGGLCLPTCDPLAQTCPAGQLCHSNLSSPAQFVCVQDSSGDSGAAFDPCQHTGCDPGLACVPPGFATECAPEDNCCTPFCDLGAPACPGRGQTCLPYFDIIMIEPNDPPPPGMADIGLCGLL